MSLLPFLLELERPRRRLNQDYGSTLTPEDILSILASHDSTEYRRPWQRHSSMIRPSSSTIKANKNKFQINLDVQHFTPEDISVKTIDGFVVIEGRHEERRDEHGWVSRRFCRRYQLPDGCDPDSVQSHLTSDGVLLITAPLNSPPVSNERFVPIIHTGPVRIQGQDISREREPLEEAQVENRH